MLLLERRSILTAAAPQVTGRLLRPFLGLLGCPIPSSLQAIQSRASARPGALGPSLAARPSTVMDGAYCGQSSKEINSPGGANSYTSTMRQPLGSNAKGALAAPCPW
jgi:hypothetical protein